MTTTHELPYGSTKAVVILACWRYVGSGYQTEGEAWLAHSAAANAREQRRAARLELAMA